MTVKPHLCLLWEIEETCDPYVLFQLLHALTLVVRVEVDPVFCGAHAWARMRGSRWRT